MLALLFNITGGNLALHHFLEHSTTEEVGQHDNEHKFCKHKNHIDTEKKHCSCGFLITVNHFFTPSEIIEIEGTAVENSQIHYSGKVFPTEKGILISRSRAPPVFS